MHIGAKLIVFAVLSLGAPAALACSCSVPGFAARYALTDNVFTAIVTGQRAEREDVTTPITYSTTITYSNFTITRAFKGDRPFETLVTRRSDIVGFCGVDLDAGAEYLFFVQNSGEIGVCGNPARRDQAGPEIAALEAFTSGKRSEVLEPWHFSLHDEGCSLMTRLDAGDGSAQGALSASGWRPGRASPTFGRAKIDVYPPAADGHSGLTLVVQGTIYEPAFVAGGYSLTRDVADDALRQILAADSFTVQWRSDDTGADHTIDVSTANLADAGTAAAMLECIGPR